MKVVHKLFLGLLFFTFAGGLLPIFAQNTQYSDYQFQQDQYRKSYATYQLFLKDYQSDPSLNNEQKAFVAAKEAIKFRESTLSHYFWWQAETLKATKLDLPLIDKTISELDSLGQYHYSQSQESSLLATKTDLTKFTKDNRKKVSELDLMTVKAQVVLKLSRLIQFQVDIKRGYDYLVRSLPDQSTNLIIKNGLEQISSNATTANELIEKLTTDVKNLDLSEKRESQFYEKSIETMIQIKSLQSRSIDIIIELDTNYVAR